MFLFRHPEFVSGSQVISKSMLSESEGEKVIRFLIFRYILEISHLFFVSIYADIILDHYHSRRFRGTVSNADHVCHVSNPLCGDKIDFTALVEKDIVTEVKFQGDGCVISLASASLISQWATGKSVKEILAMTPDAFISLLGIELSPNRMKCALLALEGLHSLFSKTSPV